MTDLILWLHLLHTPLPTYTAHSPYARPPTIQRSRRRLSGLLLTAQPPHTCYNNPNAAVLPRTSAHYQRAGGGRCDRAVADAGMPVGYRHHLPYRSSL